MTSRTTRRFRASFESLPKDVREQAVAAYRLFVATPYHPSLQFKSVHAQQPIYSARVNRNYRAVGVLAGDEIVWFWIGNHDAYESLIRSL